MARLIHSAPRELPTCATRRAYPHSPDNREHTPTPETPKRALQIPPPLGVSDPAASPLKALLRRAPRGSSTHIQSTAFASKYKGSPPARICVQVRGVRPM